MLMIAQKGAFKKVYERILMHRGLGSMYCKNAGSIPFIDAVSLEACPQKHALAPSLPTTQQLKSIITSRQQQQIIFAYRLDSLAVLAYGLLSVRLRPYGLILRIGQQSTESRQKVSEGTTSKDRIYFESYLAKGTAPDVPI